MLSIETEFFTRHTLVIRDNDKPLAVLLKYEHFLAMQEMISDEEK